MAEHVCAVYKDGSTITREPVIRCERCANMTARGGRKVCSATGRKVHNMGFCAWGKAR